MLIVSRLVACSETLSCMNKVRTASNEYSHDSKPNKGWQEKFREQNTVEQRDRVFIPHLKAGNFALFQKALVLSLSTYLEHSLCTDYNSALFYGI